MSGDESLDDALDAVAAEAKEIFNEPVMFQRVLLGETHHEDGEAEWNVFTYEGKELERVGSIRAAWPTLGVDGPVQYEGILSGDPSPALRVIAMDIGTVVLLMSIQLGRIRGKRAFP